jgi:hypothetical protein
MKFWPVVAVYRPTSLRNVALIGLIGLLEDATMLLATANFLAATRLLLRPWRYALLGAGQSVDTLMTEAVIRKVSVPAA